MDPAPADGFYALKVMKETGGHADDVTDDEVREGIRLLAECEGIFAETAGGVTVGVAVMVDRSGGKVRFGDLPFFAATEVEMQTFEAAECPLCARGVPLTIT